MKLHTKQSDSTTHYINFICNQTFGQVAIHNPTLNLEVGNLQAFLDDYLTHHPESKIDYVHGEDTTQRL